MIEKEESIIFGRYKGKIDNVIVYTHRKRRCIRRMPANMIIPSSPGQIAQQERIAAIAIFYHALKEAGVFPYWQKAAEGLLLTGYNLLVKLNLPAFSGEGSICDFSKLRITTGQLPLPDEMKLQQGDNGEWILSWSNTLNTPLAEADDRLKLIVMKDYETFDVEQLDAGDCCRKDCRITFRIPEKVKDYSHLYVFCSRADGKSSKSRYFNIHLN